ncbi:caffeic acid 3-O-methyltransferase-like [Hibiscus syriacus]|uniref:caffeic acid 3-O-methyltransferase-like n=1 Tax=Hibiscus syriacus TaxID=106335 RepID=UPI001921DC98|nr:caffeic acid 3-O-methyltransferase-like [Hibiscus syriacus]
MMTSSQQITTNEEEDCLQAFRIVQSTLLPFVLRTAVDLDLLQTIAKPGPGSKVSVAEIVPKLPARNPNAPDMIDRILRFLTAHSILDCDLVTDQNGNTTRLYGISSIGRYFLQDEDGISLVPSLKISTDRRFFECWNYLKDATLEGGLPFRRVFGEDVFEAVAKDSDLANTFNQSMSNLTNIITRRVLQVYKGFEALTQLIDVGGGLGTNLKLIVSKYPQIKGINFDLPFVVEVAPNIPGVEHVGGDMFNKIPNGEAISMKCILHDWGDEECLKLLRNCYEAIPESGKVIVIESIMPELPTTDTVTATTTSFDVGLLHTVPGGKERTLKEFQALATEAGFSTFKPVCRVYIYWVIELFK